MISGSQSLRLGENNGFRENETQSTYFNCINFDILQLSWLINLKLDNHIKFGAYPESPSYHKKNSVGAASSREIKWSRLEAAPTSNATCSFQITGLRFLICLSSIIIVYDDFQLDTACFTTFTSVLHIFPTIDSDDAPKTVTFLNGNISGRLKNIYGIISIISTLFLHISSTINW